MKLLLNVCKYFQGSAGQQIVIQQPQQAQIIQTSDGQTFIYQPMPIDGVQQSQPTGDIQE